MNIIRIRQSTGNLGNPTLLALHKLPFTTSDLTTLQVSYKIFFVSLPNWNNKGKGINLRNIIQPSQKNIWQSHHSTPVVKFILMRLFSNIFYFQRKTTKPCFHLTWYNYPVEMIRTPSKICTESLFCDWAMFILLVDSHFLFGICNINTEM